MNISPLYQRILVGVLGVLVSIAAKRYLHDYPDAIALGPLMIGYAVKSHWDASKAAP